MTEEEKKKESGEISRREFLKDAGLVVGGAAMGSTILLAACGGEETTKTVTETATKTQTQTATQTQTVTSTAPGGTETVTTTAPGGTVTKTVTETVSKFVCPICGQEFESLAELQAHCDAEHPAAPVLAENIINLTVNNQEYELQVEPGWDLQYVLHDVLGFIDIKTFCYRGACGSCTVIMDGRPILSCMKLAIECDGKNIETASGIADAKHPLIDAYIKNHCMQCGYCTPGFLTTVKAMLDRNANPTAEDVVEAIAGNMCRCGTYPQHVIATLEAAEVLRGGA